MQSNWRAFLRDQWSRESWIVVIPFKGAPHGKSRLSATAASDDAAGDRYIGFSSTERERLALAFLHDTVAAIGGVDRVARVVIVSDARELDAGRALPAIRRPVSIVPDPGRGLNAAAAEGIRAARALDPGAWIAVLTGDLASLRSRDLEQALRAGRAHPLGFVPDHSGVGTTMLTAAPGRRVSPLFGGASSAAHEAAGHRALELPADSTVRLDIDRVDDLVRASSAGIGLGPASAECLRSIGVPAGTSTGYSFSTVKHPRRMLDAIE
jgi:2-phospho-L-lactate guanylyltransferase